MISTGCVEWGVYEVLDTLCSPYNLKTFAPVALVDPGVLPTPLIAYDLSISIHRYSHQKDSSFDNQISGVIAPRGGRTSSTAAKVDSEERIVGESVNAALPHQTGPA